MAIPGATSNIYVLTKDDVDGAEHFYSISYKIPVNNRTPSETFTRVNRTSPPKTYASQYRIIR